MPPSHRKTSPSPAVGSSTAIAAVLGAAASPPPDVRQHANSIATSAALGAEADWRQAVELERRAAESHKPRTTDPLVVATILSMMRENPETELEALRKQLCEGHDLHVSLITLGKILRRNGLQWGRRASRLRELEEALLEGSPVSRWHYRKLLKENPALKERKRETSGPGQRVCVTVCPLVTPAGRIFEHVAVDTYGGMAVAELYEKGTTETAVDFLHERVLPFYRGQGLRLAGVETSRSRVYHGGDNHVYAVYLRMQGIRHETRDLGMPAVNGFMERFKQSLTNGWVQPLLLDFRNQHGQSMQEGAGTEAGLLVRLRRQLAQWIRHYNEKAPLAGYRNRGKSPCMFWQTGDKKQSARSNPAGLPSRPAAGTPPLHSEPEGRRPRRPTRASAPPSPATKHQP